ncbi:MAG TPA: winged helix-turn-helix domain-containing protein, partial [Pyrinomonadaceae bacterium]|nr:winged helix-turn-helix domain-containing protein [Pyrinomonadaceae bacterium]
MPENSQIEPRFYEFGDYSLDTKERVLRREGESLFLPPKVFDTLLALVRQSGHLVERDSLLEEVWADTFVEEANLTVNISALRKVLGTKENGKPFIETVPRRGYRFAADVTELPDDAEIVVRRTRAKISVTTEEEPQTLPETNPISKSLAVLPFQMLGGDSNTKFLGLGLADALIMQLGRQQQMLVRPTSAIREFADASQSSIEIGRKLEVGAVLEGSFQVFNERLRLTVQLFDVEKSSSLWSETFNVHFTDIFEVQ